jgi:hypothetical protein
MLGYISNYFTIFPVVENEFIQSVTPLTKEEIEQGNGKNGQNK